LDANFLIEELQSRIEEKSNTQLFEQGPGEVQVGRLGKREVEPKSNFLVQRELALMLDNQVENNLLLLPETNELVQVPRNVVTVVEAEEHVKIKDFEVFKNYLAVLQERNTILELKTINLLSATQKPHIHQFDSLPHERNPSDGERAQFYDVQFGDCLTFDETNLRYNLFAPNVPQRSINFNMGTKRTTLINQEVHQNLTQDLNKFHCERISAPMRDGTEIPVVIKYDKRFYNEDSPWVMFTSGVDSSKEMTHWKQEDLALMSRGLVCAYPVLRGTNYFDRDWLLKGTAERKLTHIMDFIDSAIFFKTTGLTSKLAVHATGESGSMTALAGVFSEPYLFETAVVSNPITDLVSHMLHDIETRSATSTSALEHDLRHFDKLAEYGDPHNRLFYESLKLISPYHMGVLDHESLHTDLYLCVDEEFPYKYHARKLVAKLREIYNKENSYVFYREFGRKGYTDDEKTAN
jgi:protease II